MKLVIQLLLWAVIFFLGYLIFDAVYDPIQFNKIKERRYTKVIERLEDIRDAQAAYQQITGSYEKDFDKLVRFIDTAQFVLTQRRDSTVLDVEYQKAYGVDRQKDIVIIDTLGYASVKDSLFKNNEYKDMMFVPIEGSNAKFEMDAGTILKNEIKIPVFMARVDKSIILHDQDKDLVAQEKQVVSVDQVNGPYIQVGSMEEVITAGNWPEAYGKTKL